MDYEIPQSFGDQLQAGTFVQPRRMALVSCSGVLDCSMQQTPLVHHSKG
jgi:hypothetical protein